MKKRLKWLLPIISAIVCAIGLFACGEAPAVPTACEHENLKHVEKIDSTCEKTGTDEYWVCLNCDKMFSDSEGATDIAEKPVISELKPHTLGDPITAVAATCIRKGNIEYYTCSVCENHFTDAEAKNRVEDVTTSIDPAAHKYGELHAGKAATCSIAGEVAHKDCEYCHKHFTEAGEELSDADLVLPIDPTAHKYGELKPANEPTCTANGYPANKECEYCHKHFTEAGEEITSATSALGHNYASIVVKTQPTKAVYSQGEDFAADGMVITATCTRDNYGEEKTITDYTITGDKNLQKGAHNITVAWNDGKNNLTAQIQVAVYEDHDLSNAGSYADFVYAETGDLTATAVGAIAGAKATVICGTATYEDGATLSGNAITLKAATVSGMLDGKKYGDFTVTFVTDSYDRYAMNIAIATKLIAGAEDLKAITATNIADTVDAYYIVTADIDASGAGTVRIVNNNTTGNDNVGFKGIFDGRGHLISNVTTYSAFNTLGGLFGQLLNGSVVRNIAFTNMSVGNDSEKFLFVGESRKMNGTVENVLVTTSDNTLKVFCALSGGRINNFVAIGINQINLDTGVTEVSNVMTVAKETEFGGFSWTGNAVYDAQPTYATVNDMIAALANDNKLASWQNSLITYADDRLLFGSAPVAVKTIAIDGECGYIQNIVYAETGTFDITMPAQVSQDNLSGVKADGADVMNAVDNGVLKLPRTILGERKYGDIELVFETNSGAYYSAKIAIITKVITSANVGDFWSNKGAPTAENVTDGYYILGEDISDKTFNALYTWDGGKGNGFAGIFDGRGHKISNSTFSASMFGYVTATGVVRNIALVNVTSSDGGILGQECTGGIYENIFISTNGRFAFSGMYPFGRTVFKNFVFVTSYSGSDAAGLFGDGNNSNGGNFNTENVLLISNQTDGYGYYGGSPTASGKTVYASTEAMWTGLATDNKLAAWQNSLITYESGAILFNGTEVVSSAA